MYVILIQNKEKSPKNYISTICLSTISCSALELLLKMAGVPEKIVTLIKALYTSKLAAFAPMVSNVCGLRLCLAFFRGAECLWTHLPQAWIIYWREQMG